MSYDYNAKLAQMSAEVCGPTRETLRVRLVRRRKDAAEHLADVERAIKFLDDNPNFESFHDLLGKTGF